MLKTTGSIADEMYNLREQKRAHEEAIKQLNGKIEVLELDLIRQMDAEGISKATGKKVTVSINEQIRPTVQDWDLFYNYIQRNKFWHLLERRPSVSGCQELFETKGTIPGVVPFKQRRVNMRSVG